MILFLVIVGGEVTRLDTDTLAKICTALDCKIEDIIEFIK